MEVTIKGTKKKIRLSKSNFVAAGGEGQIYKKTPKAYKIYTNPKSMLSYAKIQELSVIKNSNVIKPEEILLNLAQKPVGYSMTHVKDTYALCQIFPKVFRDSTGFDVKASLHIIQRMQKTISDLHKLDILIVDMNEMNFLIDKMFKEVYFIDVDSYQTKSFPATAIMESIRDWVAEKNGQPFSQLTDWFSFGILSFQIWVGMHPFKGKHPTVKGIKARMLAQLPLFHKEVKFPKVCLPFNIIPQAYRDWYKGMFAYGNRAAPPTDGVQTLVIPVIVQTVAGNESFDVVEIFEYNSDIVKYISIDGTRVTITTDDLYIANSVVPQTCNKNIHVGITSMNKVISAVIEDGDVLLFNSSDRNIPQYAIQAEEMMSYKGRIYIKNGDTFSEIDFVEMGKTLHAVPHPVANVMENATKLFDGVVIQNVLGSFVASIFPESKSHYQVQCPEFKGYQIVEAKFDTNVLIVIGSKEGKYDKFVMKFDDKFSSYSLRKVEDISYCGINFAVLDNGIVVHINEDEEIEIFSSKKDSNKVKVIDNNAIDGDMKLFSDGAKVVFAKGKKLYQLKMK